MEAIDKSTYFVKLEESVFQGAFNAEPNKNIVNNSIVEKLNLLSSLGHSIIITTSSPSSSYTGIILALYNNKIPFDRVLTDCKNGRLEIL